MNTFAALAAHPVAVAYETPPVWRILTKAGYFAGLCALLGGAATLLLAVSPVHRKVGEGAAPLRDRGYALLPFAGVAMLVLLYLQQAGLATRAGEFAFAHGLRPDVIGAFLTAPAEDGEWIAQSTLRLIQVVLLGAAAILAIVAGRLRAVRLGWAVLAVGVLGEVVAAVPTTFAGLTVDDWLKTVLTQFHILGAVVWIGGLGILAVLAARTRDVSTAGAWAAIWSRFSAMAMAAAGAILISGLWLTWQHVGAFSEFVTTAYGRFLLLKIALVGLMLAAGGFNQVVLLPRVSRALRDGSDSTAGQVVLRHFPRTVIGETVLGLAVLLVVPFLSGSARKESGGAPAPAFDGRLLLIGLLLIATILASFWATSRLARLQAGRGSLAPVPSVAD